VSMGAFKPVRDLSWIVEKSGVTLVTRDRGVFACIPYPYAALWATVVDGTYSPEWARDLMSLLTTGDQEEAERQAKLSLSTWHEMGLIEAGAVV
jgi:hypothetical protein